MLALDYSYTYGTRSAMGAYDSSYRALGAKVYY
jgi:hypothetical protein